MGSKIVVVGAGVTGLSAALRLQSDGHDVTIVAKDWPGPFESIDPKTQINFTSPWGGAHNRWVLPIDAATAQDHELHGFAQITYKTMEKLASEHPEAGITFMKGIEYFEAPSRGYQELTENQANDLGLTEFRILTVKELPKGVRWGCEYKTWCVNPMVYCSFLLRRFTKAGGKTVKKDLGGLQDTSSIGDSIQLVVNCSGRGFDDEKVYPTRGQTCLVQNNCAATVTRQNADGSWSFCVPRNFGGGTVIGGTKEPNNWDAEPSPAVRQELLDNFAKTYPAILDGLGEYKVLQDIVGRRPTREGGPRIALERSEKDKPIIHAYGLGGRGYELSWGVADKVAQLAYGLAPSQNLSKL